MPAGPTSVFRPTAQRDFLGDWLLRREFVHRVSTQLRRRRPDGAPFHYGDCGICGGVTVQERYASDGATSPYLVFEWLLAEALVRQSDGDAVLRMPRKKPPLCFRAHGLHLIPSKYLRKLRKYESARQWYVHRRRGFRQRYRQTYGVDIVGDDEFLLRIDGVSDKTRHGEQARIDMMTRDRHLLGLIEQQLTETHSILVVYGGSHWSTLSTAFEKRLGKPKITPFLK